MAEYQNRDNIMFDEARLDDGSSDESIGEDEVREMELRADDDRIKKLSVREAKCDVKGCVLSVVGKIALYLCYVCNIYLCESCLKVHDKMHDFVRVESEERDRRKMAHMLVGRMRSERMRESNINVEDVKVYGRVNVKHALDNEDCYIDGLCGLQDKRWVVLDYNNYCMKIFSSVTNTLLRYVRLSRPRDVTEITKKSTDPNSASGSKSGVSGSARGDLDKQCLLAVTFPYRKQIWFIDLNQTPAVKTKTIEMYKQCYEIEFSEDKIFTLCREGGGLLSRYSVDILSAEGDKLNVIQTDIDPYIADLAVYENRIYVTDYYNNKVWCINVEDGKTVSQLHIKGLGLRGISVDPSNNVLYVCGSNNNKVYKLSPDLRGYEVERINLDTEYTERPRRICFTDGKLFVGHWSSSLGNFVTVIQLT